MPIQPKPTADTSSPPLPNVRFCIVLLLLSWPEDAYPKTIASHPKPQSPRDLPTHHCINFRHGSAGVYHWSSTRVEKSLTPVVVSRRQRFPRSSRRCGHEYVSQKTERRIHCSQGRERSRR